MRQLIFVIIILAMASFTNAQAKAKTRESSLTCKLTSPELRESRATVIASLKKQMIEKKELKNGFAYKFTGSDSMVDELATFVKTERACCDFFFQSFNQRG